VPRIMRVSVGKSVCVLSAAAVTVICSCEKHPLPEEREAHTEQVAPEKASSEHSKIESEKPLSSPTPVEFPPASPRP
jgi:hypothetical protein